MSKTKKGISLVEVVCSLALFSIFLSVAITTNNISLKARKSNKNLEEWLFLTEALKNEIVLNLTYPEIEEIISKNNRYIVKNNLSMEVIKSKCLKEILTDDAPNTLPYAKFDFEDGAIIKIKITLYYAEGEENILESVSYKGKYL